jgi:hypothetical protein
VARVAATPEEVLRREAPVDVKDSEQLIFPDVFVSVAAAPPCLTARLVGGRIGASATAGINGCERAAECGAL